MKDHSGAKLISLERTRQQRVEGYHISHDDGHDAGELVRAAIGYCYSAIGNEREAEDAFPAGWDFNPKTPIRDLVRAGALIAAEIDRLRRAAPADGATGEGGKE